MIVDQSLREYNSLLPICHRQQQRMREMEECLGPPRSNNHCRLKTEKTVSGWSDKISPNKSTTFNAEALERDREIAEIMVWMMLRFKLGSSSLHAGTMEFKG